MSARWWTFGVWTAVAVSALYWGIRLFLAEPPDPRITRFAEMGSGATPGDLARLLGAEAPPVPPAEIEAQVAEARFHLLGVISPRPARAAREGLALIAVDGNPPKVIRVGAVIEGQIVLQSVDARSVRLGPRDGTAWVLLSLTPPAFATTNVLPANAKSLQQSLAPVQLRAPLTQQQAFNQRQQIQFEQEEMQNHGPYPADPPPLLNGNSPADPSKLR